MPDGAVKEKRGRTWQDLGTRMSDKGLPTRRSRPPSLSLSPSPLLTLFKQIGGNEMAGEKGETAGKKAGRIKTQLAAERRRERIKEQPL